MKFIFPQNYNFNFKLFGFIDYQVAIFDTIFSLLFYFFISIFICNLYLKIILFISVALPVFIVSIVGFNHENIIYVFLYMYKFYKNKQVYLFTKK